MDKELRRRKMPLFGVIGIGAVIALIAVFLLMSVGWKLPSYLKDKLSMEDIQATTDARLAAQQAALEQTNQASYLTQTALVTPTPTIAPATETPTPTVTPTVTRVVVVVPVRPQTSGDDGKWEVTSVNESRQPTTATFRNQVSGETRTGTCIDPGKNPPPVGKVCEYANGKFHCGKRWQRFEEK